MNGVTRGVDGVKCAANGVKRALIVPLLDGDSLTLCGFPNLFKARQKSLFTGHNTSEKHLIRYTNCTVKSSDTLAHWVYPYHSVYTCIGSVCVYCTSIKGSEYYPKPLHVLKMVDNLRILPHDKFFGSLFPIYFRLKRCRLHSQIHTP